MIKRKKYELTHDPSSLLSIEKISYHMKSQSPTLRSQNHRRIIQSNSWILTAPPKNQTMRLRALSKCFLNSSRLGAVTTALWGLSQCPTTLWVQNLSLTPSLTLPCPSSMPFPWGHSSSQCEANSVPSALAQSQRHVDVLEIITGYLREARWKIQG